MRPWRNSFVERNILKGRRNVFSKSRCNFANQQIPKRKNWTTCQKHHKEKNTHPPSETPEISRLAAICFSKCRNSRCPRCNASACDGNGFGFAASLRRPRKSPGRDSATRSSSFRFSSFSYFNPSSIAALLMRICICYGILAQRDGWAQLKTRECDNWKRFGCRDLGTKHLETFVWCLRGMQCDAWSHVSWKPAFAPLKPLSRQWWGKGCSTISTWIVSWA